MKILIVGAGASGIVAAINYKRNHFHDDVLVIEHLDKPLKKILSTGNGKCNLGNHNLNFSLYNNSVFSTNIIKNYSYKEFFSSICVETKTFGDLAYPISESAVTVRDALLKECDKLKIKINLNESIVDYEIGSNIKVKTNKNTYCVDKLFLAGGLKSSPKLGSDGSLIEILKKHEYKINPISPGLCPIYTVEKTKELDGIRCKANVKLFDKNALIHEESGEVLFKNHGLSGIVIFNTSSIISRKSGTYKISLDLLPDYSIENLKIYIKTHTFSDFLQAFINPKISSYLINRFEDEETILNAIKNLEFTFDKSYGFDFSQVSVGGIDVSELDKNLMSKREKNVFIIGELVDIDGPCGGYNLTWAFASAIKSTNF